MFEIIEGLLDLGYVVEMEPKSSYDGDFCAYIKRNDAIVSEAYGIAASEALGRAVNWLLIKLERGE